MVVHTGACSTHGAGSTSWQVGEVSQASSLSSGNRLRMGNGPWLGGTKFASQCSMPASGERFCVVRLRLSSTRLNARLAHAGM